jgi:hypothetical protein
MRRRSQRKAAPRVRRGVFNDSIDGFVYSFLAAPLLQPSCAVDSVLTGIHYVKGQVLFLALVGYRYPERLWTKVWPEDGPRGKAEGVRREQRQIDDGNFMST